MTTTATHPFQAEVSQVLKLVIHSLYSHKEIFLRELISNASDALDKLRFRSTTDSEIMRDDPTMEIRIIADKERGLLRIEDTGVGMTETELIKNLGTVAHSGSRAFLEQLAQNKGAAADLALIGQFGVGFYSAYLVADKVEVITLAAGPDAQAVKWSSDANETFTVEPATRTQRGTEVVLHLREDQREFLDDWKLRDLCKRYSDYVAYPIKLEVQRQKEGEEGEEVKLEQINRASALWRRPKAEITATEYEELYKHLTHDFEPPLARTHFKVEGKQDFVALLYIPRHAPFDLHDGKTRRGLRLFVRRVFIMDDCEELVPQWLRFLRGVIDSDDLPLNVSRELLQDSTAVRAIKKQVIKRTLDLLDGLAEKEPADYLTFWHTFGAILKESLAFDAESKDRVAGLVRYESTQGEELTSLAAYVARMPEKQEAIYYMYGPSRVAIAGSPYIEGLRARGYEVLLMTDPVDEWAANGIGEFGGKRLVSAMMAELPLDESQDQKATKTEATATLKPLVERIAQTLSAHIREVTISERLTDSPCCLVLARGATPAYMEQLLKSSGRPAPHAKRILELNPSHALIRNLADVLKNRPDSPRIDEWIEVLYSQALIAEGSPIEDPNRFARHVAALLTEATGAATPVP